MSNSKDIAPLYGGYSYKKIITKKNKRGTKIFYEISKSGKRKQVKREEFDKAKITKDYFRSEYPNEWRKRYSSAITQFRQIEGSIEARKASEKADYLKKRGYPLELTMLQTGIISEVEMWISEGYKVYLLKDGKRILLTIDKAENFRELMQQFLDFFFEEFKENLQAVEKLENDKRTKEGKAKEKANKYAKKKTLGGLSPFLQVPQRQVSGGIYGIEYEVDLDKVLFVDMNKLNFTENQFLDYIKTKFNKFFYDLF